MRVLVVVSVLFVGVAWAAVVDPGKGSKSARVKLHEDKKFNGKTGRPAAFDHCMGMNNQHIAHVGQIKLDHEERRERHGACAWTYERGGPRRVTCDDDDKDDDGWCKPGTAKAILCRDRSDPSREYGVYCRESREDEHWDYKDGEMLEAFTFDSDEEGEKVYTIAAAKAICEGKGMHLAYSSQLAVMSARYNTFHQCRHCFLRKNHALYSVNCEGNHEFDFWIQDTDEAQCFTCFGQPESKKYEHPCKMNYPTYGGKRVYCDRDSNGKINGDIIVQSRSSCEIETDTNKNEGCRFASMEWHQFKHGFGKNEDCLWMGLESQHIITNNMNFGLRVEIEDREGKFHYIEYDEYMVGPENKEDHETKLQYVMRVGDHTGGDLDDQFKIVGVKSLGTISGSAFCTSEHNNDRDLPTKAQEDVNCASLLGGVGWWFNWCDTASNLNGLCPNDLGYDEKTMKCRVWGKYKNFKKSRMVLTYDKEKNKHLGESFHDF